MDVSIQHYFIFGHGFQQYRQVGSPAPVNQQTVKRIAHTWTACFCVQDNGCTSFQISAFIKISMNNPSACLNDRHFCMLTYIIDQVLTSPGRSEEHTSELQSLMRISYAVFCLKKKKTNK